MLSFDTDYFTEEERLGFTIPLFMKNAWAAELEILDRVDKVCRENDIKYFANWGTLLGTIRHRGIIPWDDDIDLCMLRSDIDRFAEAIKHYDNIEMLDIYNSPEHGPRANRVIAGTIFSMERNFYKDYYGFPFPVGVDIFPLDYVPRDKALEEEMVEALKVCATADHERTWLDEHDAFADKDYATHILEYQAAVKWLTDNCGVKFSEENPSDQEILILRQEIMGMYGPGDSDYITEMHSLANGTPYYIPKEVFEKSIRLPFENTTIPVPVDYNEMLELKYGSDYMVPKNIAAGHDYPFYDGFIEAMYNPERYDTLEEFSEYIQNISARFYVSFLGKTSDSVLQLDEDDVDALSDRMHISHEEVKTLAAQCELLEEFKRLCDKIDIPYYAINETLIAAETGDYSEVVKRGLEVAIHREDLGDFLEILPQQLDPWYNYSTMYSHDNHEDVRMILWSEPYMCEPNEFAKRFHGCTDSVYLYVSIIDLVTDDAERDEIRQVLTKNLFVTAKSMPTTPPYSEDVMALVREWEGILQISIDTSKNLKAEFIKHADRMSGDVRGEHCSKVRLNSDYQDGIDAVYNVSDFSDTINVPFAITKIEVPHA